MYNKGNSWACGVHRLILLEVYSFLHTHVQSLKLLILTAGKLMQTVCSPSSESREVHIIRFSLKRRHLTLPEVRI